METENKTINENIKSSGQSEIDDSKELNSNTDTGLDVFWTKIGDMTFSEGLISLRKYIKIKHIVLAIGLCIGVIIAYFIGHHVISKLLHILWADATYCWDICVGNNKGYQYSLFDGDLINSIPFILFIAVIIGLLSNRKKILYVVLYFIMLLFILEIWDYWHIEYDINGILGAVCFVIMFIIIPILYVIRWLISVLTDNAE